MASNLTFTLLVAASLLHCLAAERLAAVETGMLKQAHAHNDYLHERPLEDALQQGFGSVEADVFLVDGQLLVAHTKSELDTERTLEKLYLEPLRQRIKNNAGSVYGDGEQFTLLIDIKSEADPTYRRLNQVLRTFADVFAINVDGKRIERPVVAVISGNRPIRVMSAARERYAGIDGRLSDIESTLPADLMPLISDNWRVHFTWRGEGEMPPAEREKLLGLVKKIQSSGRRVRFWATPDTREAWAELHHAGVDLINTDDLKGLAEFLNKQTK